MNLLILSPGRRVDIVQYFKETFHQRGGNVYTLDISLMAPALYFGDKFYKVDKDHSNIIKYIDDVIDICKMNNITHVLTLIDPELSLLSKYRNLFSENCITPIISEKEFIDATFDKYQFYQKYKKNVKLVDTEDSYEKAISRLNTNQWDFPLFAKLRDGSASIGIVKINCMSDFELTKNNEKYIYQPFVDGVEYGVDVYFDLISGELVSAFIKRKIAMRAGETDKSISVISQTILCEIKRIQSIWGIRGPIDVDVFVDEKGEIFVNEINPRFGGGYPHAYGCGVNFMELIFNNMVGQVNKPCFDNYDDGVLMLKYNGLFFKKTVDE